MKHIIAIIKPFRFDEVQEALHPLGIETITVTEVRGYSGRRPIEGLGGGEERLRVELAVGDDQLEAALKAFEAARTGQQGDGSIYVGSLDQVVLVRYGQILR